STLLLQDIKVIARPGGKILISANSYGVPGPGALKSAGYIARLNSDGSFDVSFNHSGIIKVDFGSGSSYDQLLTMAVQGDGKIVGMGTVTTDHDKLGLARWNTDGSPDQGFGTRGKSVIETFSRYDGFNNLVVTPDGKLLLMGSILNTQVSSWNE